MKILIKIEAPSFTKMEFQINQFIPIQNSEKSSKCKECEKEHCQKHCNICTQEVVDEDDNEILKHLYRFHKEKYCRIVGARVDSQGGTTFAPIPSTFAPATPSTPVNIFLMKTPKSSSSFSPIPFGNDNRGLSTPSLVSQRRFSVDGSVSPSLSLGNYMFNMKLFDENVEKHNEKSRGVRLLTTQEFDEIKQQERKVARKTPRQEKPKVESIQKKNKNNSKIFNAEISKQLQEKENQTPFTLDALKHSYVGDKTPSCLCLKNNSNHIVDVRQGRIVCTNCGIISNNYLVENIHFPKEYATQHN